MISELLRESSSNESETDILKHLQEFKDVDLLPDQTIQILKNIQEDIKKLESKIGELDKKCQLMCEHITFIEKIYTSVKRPFHWVMNGVNSYIPSKLDKPDDFEKIDWI